MSGLFENLSKKLEGIEAEQGISAWDLAQLPAAQRRIIRLILRDVQLPYRALCRAAAALPGEERLNRAEVDRILEDLLQEAWLVRLGQGERVTYRVNLRRKRGSKLDSSIWERLGRRLESPE
jgi:hypothetical protein